VRRSERVIRVLIADDHPTTRAGIRAILAGQDGIEAVGEAEDGSEAMRLVEQLQPDILLLDLVMPGPRPSEVERWVRAHHPETTTLVLTAHDRDCFLAKMVEAGVKGFLSKEESPATLVDAIRRAERGDVLITSDQFRRVESWRSEVAERWESLTSQERQVLLLLKDGLCTKELSKSLFIEETTVRTHIGNILGKLGVESRAAAIAWAWKSGAFEAVESGRRPEARRRAPRVWPL